MAKSTFDERLAALIADPNSAAHKAVVEATTKKSTTSTSRSSSASDKK